MKESKIQVDFFKARIYPCSMKQSNEMSKRAEDYRRVEQAILYLEKNFRKQPGLDEIAAAVNLSRQHFHRVFKRWAGVTANRFLQYLTLEYSRKLLRQSHSVLDASIASGLSGSGRLHDLFITFNGLRPGEFRKYGEGLGITYGFHQTPFGTCFLAVTPGGICSLRFIHPDSREEILAQMQKEWSKGVFRENVMATHSFITGIFSEKGGKSPVHLELRGTDFQLQVWQALLAIPLGARVSYRDLAAFIGRPKAVRGVASAVARNPVAWLIPCHRVISSTGKIHKYRWGAPRKKAMLGWEASRLEKAGKGS